MKVPSLVGLTKDQAIAALTAQDVLLNTNIETVQTQRASCRALCFRRALRRGTLVAQNSTVTIRVAATPTQTTAPDYCGYSACGSDPVTRTLLLVTSNVLPRLTSRLLSRGVDQ